MTTLEIYRAQFEEERTWYPHELDKYEWAARDVFDLFTCDGGLDKTFVKTILDVCRVILEQNNYEYISNEESYIKYILVCQLLRRFGWINWGTSIRGAWFENMRYMNTRPKDIIEALTWCESDGEHRIAHVEFTPDNLRALLEFMDEE